MYVLLFPFLAHGASGNSARNSDKNSNTSVALVSPMHYATPKGKVQMVPDFHMGKHDMGKSKIIKGGGSIWREVACFKG